MDVVAKSAFCCKELGGEQGKSQTEEGEPRPSKGRRGQGLPCQRKPVGLAQSCWALGKWCSRLPTHISTRHVRGRLALQLCRLDRAADCFLELTMHLPVSSLHCQFSSAEKREGQAQSAGGTPAGVLSLKGHQLRAGPRRASPRQVVLLPRCKEQGYSGPLPPRAV